MNNNNNNTTINDNEKYKKYLNYVIYNWNNMSDEKKDDYYLKAKKIKSQAFKLTEYIKTEFHSSFKNNKERRKKCMRDIGKGFANIPRYLFPDSFNELFKEFNDRQLYDLEKELQNNIFNRKAFCNWISCSREEANLIDNIEMRSKGYFMHGEYCPEYGYFKYKTQLTDMQKEWLENYTECCYHYGQPCERYQNDYGNADEDCECVLGKEDGSIILSEIDEDYEKELGVWVQENMWQLNYCGEKNYTHYYSLQKLKKDCLCLCDCSIKNDKEDCEICEYIMEKYKGNECYSKGNIKITYYKDGMLMSDEYIKELKTDALKTISKLSPYIKHYLYKPGGIMMKKVEKNTSYKEKIIKEEELSFPGKDNIEEFEHNNINYYISNDLYLWNRNLEFCGKYCEDKDVIIK